VEGSGSGLIYGTISLFHVGTEEKHDELQRDVSYWTGMFEVACYKFRVTLLYEMRSDLQNYNKSYDNTGQTRVLFRDPVS
jgi:hypothetical protein